MLYINVRQCNLLDAQTQFILLHAMFLMLLLLTTARW